MFISNSIVDSHSSTVFSTFSTFPLSFYSRLRSCRPFPLCIVASDGTVLHFLTGAYRREWGSIIKDTLLCWSNHVVPHCRSVLDFLCTHCTYSLLYALTLYHTHTLNTTYCKALNGCYPLLLQINMGKLLSRVSLCIKIPVNQFKNDRRF